MTGDELVALHSQLPPYLQRASGDNAPGPDNQEIKDVLIDADFIEGRTDFAKAADALSLMCQATPNELLFDQIVGAFTIPVGFSELHGIISSGDADGITFRLRGTPNLLYAATETLLQDVVHVLPKLEAEDLSCVIKERGSDREFERLSFVLLRRQRSLKLLKAAGRQGLIEPLTWLLAILSMCAIAASACLHFAFRTTPSTNTLGSTVVWLDGWVGRFGSAAIFGFFTSLGLLLARLKGVMSQQDGVYMTFEWQKAPV